jgi:hypothetical protein
MGIIRGTTLTPKDLERRVSPNNGATMMLPQLQRRNAQGTFELQEGSREGLDDQPAQATLAAGHIDR